MGYTLQMEGDGEKEEEAEGEEEEGGGGREEEINVLSFLSSLSISV